MANSASKATRRTNTAARNLYLPITSLVREFEAKLLLALFACEAGFEPYLGFKSAFRARRIPLEPGYFIAHNARQKADKIARIAHFGHQVLVLDEEALVRQSDELFLKKHSREVFDFVHHILCWGEDDRRMWERSDFDLKCETSIVGNPRMDMLRPELAAYHAGEVDRLRQTYGDYVLLNTNFPTINEFKHSERGIELANWALDSRGEQIKAEFLENKRKLYHAMLALVRPLADAISPMTLVVRPHPSEDRTPWEAAAKDAGNVRVVLDGSVVPWLIGASALVHNSCTTAVEAAVAGKPVLNYRPWHSPHDNELAHAFGIDCANVDEIVDALQKVANGKVDGRTPAQRDVLRDHVTSADGALSCERIVALLADPQGSIGEPETTGFSQRAELVFQGWRLWFRRIWKLVKSRSGRQQLNRLRLAFPRRSIFTIDYEMLHYNAERLEQMMRHFTPPETGEVNASIERFARALGRFEGVEAIERSDGLLAIRRKGRRTDTRGKN